LAFGFYGKTDFAVVVINAFGFYQMWVGYDWFNECNARVRINAEF
jgi:hypothetical protein